MTGKKCECCRHLPMKLAWKAVNTRYEKNAPEMIEYLSPGFICAFGLVTKLNSFHTANESYCYSDRRFIFLQELYDKYRVVNK